MYYDDLASHRIDAGLRVKELADLAGIDRTTISRVEKHHQSTPETLSKIVTALNDRHYDMRGKTLDFHKVVTKKSRYGGNE